MNKYICVIHWAGPPKTVYAVTAESEETAWKKIYEYEFDKPAPANMNDLFDTFDAVVWCVTANDIATAVKL